MAWNVPDNLTAADDFGATRYGKLRDSIIADSHAVFPLGGSRSLAIPTGGGYQDAQDYIEFSIPSANYGGFVFKAVVQLLVENAAIDVTPKIRNVTDATDAVVGSASASTSWAEQELTFTPAAGKVYRLQLSKSADTYQAWGLGIVRRTHA